MMFRVSRLRIVGFILVFLSSPSFVFAADQDEIDQVRRGVIPPGQLNEAGQLRKNIDKREELESAISHNRLQAGAFNDVNGDLVINIIDLVTVAQKFGQRVGFDSADRNGDGIVDIIDLVSVAQQFGESRRGETPAPVVDVVGTGQFAGNSVGAFGGARASVRPNAEGAVTVGLTLDRLAGFASWGFDFDGMVDVKGDTLVLYVKGKEGTQFIVNFRDQRWHQLGRFDQVQASSGVIRLSEALWEKEGDYYRVEIDLSKITGNGIDFSKLKHVAIEFGTAALRNPVGTNFQIGDPNDVSRPGFAFVGESEVPILGAPGWVSVPEQITAPGAVFDWQEEPSSILYRVQIATDPNFQNLTADFHTSDTSLTVTPGRFDSLQDGTYYIRVAGMNSQVEQGPWSTARQFKIAEEQVVPPAARVEIVAGDNGFRLFFDGNPLEVQGIVYQPVPDGRHINDFRNNYAGLFKALLDEQDGGQGHARMLSEMGVTTIRVYELSTTNQADIEAVKAIFRQAFEQYGITVVVGNWAGLWTNPNDRDAIREDVRRMVEAYKDEPWLLGWMIGNENNEWIQDGIFGTRINMNRQEYFQFMDELAAIVQSVDPDHPVMLGNRGLSDEEARLINQHATHFDALAMTSYTAPAGFRSILDAADRINLPVIISEFGRSAGNPAEVGEQLGYLNSITALLHQNRAGGSGTGGVVGFFIFEFTNEKWKAADSGNPREAQFGIIGNGFDFGDAIAKAEEPRLGIGEHKEVAVKETVGDYVLPAWNHINNEEYTFAIDEIEAMLAHHPDWLQIGAQQNETANGRYPSEIYPGARPGNQAWDNLWTNYWALNDLGAAHFILVMAYTELERYYRGRGQNELADLAHQKALDAAVALLTLFSHSEVWDPSGWFWKPAVSLEREYGILFNEAQQLI